MKSTMMQLTSSLWLRPTRNVLKVWRNQVQHTLQQRQQNRITFPSFSSFESSFILIKRVGIASIIFFTSDCITQYYFSTKTIRHIDNQQRNDTCNTTTTPIHLSDQHENNNELASSYPYGEMTTNAVPGRSLSFYQFMTSNFPSTLSEHATQEDEGSNQQIIQWDTTRSLSAANFGLCSTLFLHYWWNYLDRTVNTIFASRNNHRHQLIQPMQTPVTTKVRLQATFTKVLIHQSCIVPIYIYSYYILTNFIQQVLQQQPDIVSSRQRNLYPSPEVIGSATVQATSSSSSGHLKDYWNLYITEQMQDLQNIWHNVNVKATEMWYPTLQRHWSVWPFIQFCNFYFVPLVHHRIMIHNSLLMIWSGYLSYLNHDSGKSRSGQS